jgi:hypothetical protein
MNLDAFVILYENRKSLVVQLGPHLEDLPCQFVSNPCSRGVIGQYLPAVVLNGDVVNEVKIVPGHTRTTRNVSDSSKEDPQWSTGDEFNARGMSRRSPAASALAPKVVSCNSLGGM